jgi:serine/threonine-protein kinase RsbW
MGLRDRIDSKLGRGRIATSLRLGRHPRHAKVRYPLGSTSSVTRLTLLNRLAEIPRALDWVEARCRRRAIPDDVVLALSLSLDELLHNLMTHGLHGQEHARIKLQLSFDGHQVMLSIEDDAPAFDPWAVPLPPLRNAQGEWRIGALGLRFVRAMVDDISCRRIRGRNFTRVRKSWREARPPDSATDGGVRLGP